MGIFYVPYTWVVTDQLEFMNRLEPYWAKQLKKDLSEEERAEIKQLANETDNSIYRLEHIAYIGHYTEHFLEIIKELIAVPDREITEHDYKVATVLLHLADTYDFIPHKEVRELWDEWGNRVDAIREGTKQD